MTEKGEENRDKQSNNEVTKKKTQSDLGYSFVTNAVIVCRVPKCHLSLIAALVTWAISPSPLRVALTWVIARHGTQRNAL